MGLHNNLHRLFIMGVIFTFVFSGCTVFSRLPQNPKPSNQPQMRITLIEAYQGVRDGNTESVRLPIDNIFITVKICVENLSAVQQSVYLHDIFLATKDTIQIFPVALGYDQAEAFSWLLPIAEPIGGKRITHKFYFFLIQKNELFSIPAYQSLGCKASAQFKSLAPLFIVNRSAVDEPYKLHFLSAEIPFTAKKDLPPLLGYVKWGTFIGFLLIVIAVAVIVIRTKNLKVQASPLPEEQGVENLNETRDKEITP